jgi:two-component system, sensor histidine kinase
LLLGSKNLNHYVKQFGIISLAFVSYYAFAKFGLLFAIPPGFASTIWPAAGVGLAMYLIAGRVSLIGVFAGSFLSNYEVALQKMEIAGTIAIQIPLIVSTSSVLFMIVAKWLLGRYCQLPVNPTSLSSLIKFLLLIGPVACLTSSLLSSSAITYLNDLDFSTWAFIAFTWWIGDLLGVIFFTPILLALTNNDYYSNRKEKLKITIPAMVLFVIVTSLFWLSRSNYHETREKDFIRSTDQLSQKLNLVENTIKQQLLAINALFLGSENVTREEFKQFVNKIRNPNVKVRALAYMPRIAFEEKAAYEQQVSSNDFAGFSISHLVNGKVIPAQKQNFYLPILYTEPLEANRPAVGLDVATHAVVGTTVAKAIETGEMSVTRQLSLVQQLEKYNGVIVYTPFYETSFVPGSVRERYTELIGMFEAVIELDKLILGLLNEINDDNFVFQVHYVQNNSTTAFFDSDFRSDSLFSHSNSFPFFDTEIKILFASSKSFDSQSIDWASWLIIVVGCLVSSLCLVFVIIMTNLSEMLEKKVAIKTEQLQVKNEELTKANDAKSSFLANMSHEYRTPLNAIIGFAQLGKHNQKDTSGSSYYDQILNSSRLLLGIINNVLDFSKISEQQIVLENKPFAIKKSVESVENLLKDKATGKSILLNVETQGLENVEVIGDSVRFEQIMINLVENAIKFTPKGKVSFRVAIEPQPNDLGQLTILVKDEGIGIPADKIDTLFESFTQADESTTRRFGGTGLGLAIVSQLTNLMNGELKVTSHVGEGSTFVVGFEVPIRVMTQELDEATIKQKQQYLAELEMIKNHKFTALVVEDNKINQLIATKQLALLNIECETADNGQEGLDVLEHFTPDILFIDLHMPVIDGFNMIQKINLDPIYNDIPKVVISASVSKEDIETARALGVTEYVTKPFLTEDLEAVCHRLLLDKATI